jgi:hypothetical protein
MRIGTSHFISYKAAIKYYKDYHYEDTKAAVDRKLAEGEIHIGPPRIRPGELLTVNDEARYIIEQRPCTPAQVERAAGREWNK